jgi:phospholipase/carboxylesterase
MNERRRRQIVGVFVGVVMSVVVLVLAVSSVGAANAHGPVGQRLKTLVRGGGGPPTLLLLHGYGAKAADWEPFTQTIAVPAGARFVFPRAPEKTFPPDGPIGGRAWWRLDLEDHVPPRGGLPDLAATHPAGLDAAAALVRALRNELSRSPGGPVVLGGFSQGAMVASEIAFTTSDELAALVILSGTPIDEASWRLGFARRRGLPVFISHGRADPTLPFASAERLQRELAQAGLKVTWFPFEGGHEIPAQVVVALNAFLTPLFKAK